MSDKKKESTSHWNSINYQPVEDILIALLDKDGWIRFGIYKEREYLCMDLENYPNFQFDYTPYLVKPKYEIVKWISLEDLDEFILDEIGWRKPSSAFAMNAFISMKLKNGIIVDGVEMRGSNQKFIVHSETPGVTYEIHPDNQPIAIMNQRHYITLIRRSLEE